jgi:hypothetical protein
VLARFPLALLGVIALVVVGCGGDSNSSNSTSAAAIKGGSSVEISGAWAGKLTQARLAPFKVAVAIFNGTARVAYTGIDCAGDWKLAGGGDPGPAYVFTETINQGAGGKCKGTGTVHLERSSNRLRYRFAGGGVTSEGVLRHAPTHEFVTIFRKAGIEVGTGSSHCPKGAPVCTADGTVTGTAPVGTTTMSGQMSK